MDMYFRFIASLALGLLGLGFVLKMLIDTLFVQWDAYGDLLSWLREGGFVRRSTASGRVEDLMLEIEKDKTPTLNTRLLDARREQLREIGVVEHRLQLSTRQAPVVLTPIVPSEPSSPAQN